VTAVLLHLLYFNLSESLGENLEPPHPKRTDPSGDQLRSAQADWREPSPSPSPNLISMSMHRLDVNGKDFIHMVCQSSTTTHYSVL
jgi:hypothetical protein